MKHRSIAKNALFGAITFALAQPALAVTDEEFRELQEQFNLLAEQVEANSSTTSDTTVGGYGELHYNNLSNGKGKDKKEMDFHRFVLFFGHRFNDKTRFFSELELEHSAIADTDDGSSPGSVSIEQAYVQFDLNDNTKANAGILLMPVGFINETHEPPTFYGVERNVINKYLIPTTWREGGASITGNFDSGISYDIVLHTGLDGGTNIRKGRQKVAEANASNLASTARVKYTGITGLELGATLQYQDDMTQGTNKDIGSATMTEAHVRWNVSDLTLTALYLQWNIDVASTASAENLAKDVQNGGYIEASYKLTPKWGVFARQN
ncbi:MAG: porin, partial [Gammaproteobacteria bacterium]